MVIKAGISIVIIIAFVDNYFKIQNDLWIKKIYIDLVENRDLNDIVEVYNSNKKFLLNHTESDIVEYKWVIKELELMKKIFILVKLLKKVQAK